MFIYKKIFAPSSNMDCSIIKRAKFDKNKKTKTYPPFPSPATSFFFFKIAAISGYLGQVRPLLAGPSRWRPDLIVPPHKVVQPYMVTHD